MAIVRKVFSFWPMLFVVAAGLFIMIRFVTPVQIVETGSMSPTITPGSYVLDIPVSHVSPGDVITFREEPGGAVVTHRVASVSRSGVIQTKGDANAFADTPVRPVTIRDVIGVVATGRGIPAITLWIWVAVILGFMAFLNVLRRRWAALSAAEESSPDEPERAVAPRRVSHRA